jgi:UDP-glucose 4-epimerase
MKILVTGGAGFIGSNVVDGYVREGHEVIVVDNLSTGRKENLNPKARFYLADIRSEHVKEIMTRERPQILNHHAAQISVPASVADPIKDADINIRGLLNLLQSAVRHGLKKVIFISSGGAIYGEAKEYPTTESYLPQPLSPYAVSKLVSEYYLAWYENAHGLEFTVLRYANVYGPRQISHGETGVVSIFMENLLRGRPSTLNHFPEDEEGMIRDYCYVGDVVRANLMALSRGDGGAFNIGTTRETKTLQLYRMIYEAVCEIRPETPSSLASPMKEPARPGDVRRSCLSVKRAGHELGWFPETDIASGLRLTLRWWIENRANQASIQLGNP